MLDIDELKKLHDKAYNANQVAREQAANDLVFYWVTQWDDQLLQDSELSYRGEFNVLRKAGRQIMADLRANPVSVDFTDTGPNAEDNADFVDGLYRADDRKNFSIEAFDYASQDSVVCGFGAWELFADYETSRLGDRNQVIKRRFIPEANNTAFCDPNAKALDKSDAMYWSILNAYSEDGYKELVADITGDDTEDISCPSFKHPEDSLTFPWVVGQKLIYVVSFYHKKKVKDKVLFFTDFFGQEVTLLSSEFEDEIDDLVESGYELIDEKEIERWEVTKYIADGERILSSDVIPCEYIPVIPVYGERAFIEGEEYWSGCTRLAKDPSRLRNFQLSYLADIVSRSPRPKPIYFADQLAGLEDMHEASGADNNLPYLLQQRYDAQGKELPGGPVGMTPEQPIPSALMASIDLTKSAVLDVADAGLPQDIADPDLSGKAVLALQNQMDKQSYIYQHNMKMAKRYDGVVWASMAKHLYDAPRKTTIVLPDGTKKQVEVMQQIVTDDGEFKTINDLSNSEFEVSADIGPSYSTQKQQAREQISALIPMVQDPSLASILTMKLLELSDGDNTKDVREYVRKQLIQMGVKEPETEEEMITLMQAQQAAASQPNPAMMEGQARIMEGQAAIQNEINDANKIAVDQFNAETKRAEVEIKAAEAGVKIQNTQADTEGKMLDNTSKQMDNISRLYQPVSQMM